MTYLTVGVYMIWTGRQVNHDEQRFAFGPPPSWMDKGWGREYLKQSTCRSSCSLVTSLLSIARLVCSVMKLPHRLFYLQSCAKATIKWPKYLSNFIRFIMWDFQMKFVVASHSRLQDVKISLGFQGILAFYKFRKCHPLNAVMQMQVELVETDVIMRTIKRVLEKGGA